ncbi:type II secretion system F family protein [Candidatus Woesearchaeota archaeon]|nr:type II secretion system F family protein [Candidatus Woesearchaeota archaeon]
MSNLRGYGGKRRMRFKRKYWYGITIGLIFFVLDILFLRGTRVFIPLMIISLSIAWGQIWGDFFLEGRRRKEYESRFLDFVRNLVGAIKSGMPAPKAIIHIGNETDYGALTPYIKKLANQLEWAVPVHKALRNFSKGLNNEIISRSISTVIEAELAGGNIEDVLESITVSLVEIKKIKDQRRASIHSQVLQSYVIFFVFLGIMIVIQNLLIPYLTKMGGVNIAQGDVSEGIAIGLSAEVSFNFSSLFAFLLSLRAWLVSLPGIFLMLAMIQGFFAGVTVGKLSEGDMASGLKHSLILMTVAFIIMTFAAG